MMKKQVSKQSKENDKIPKKKKTEPSDDEEEEEDDRGEMYIPKPNKGKDQIDVSDSDGEDSHSNIQKKEFAAKTNRGKEKPVKKAVELKDISREDSDKAHKPHDPYIQGTVHKVSKTKGFNQVTDLVEGAIRNKIHQEVEKKVGKIGAQLLVGDKILGSETKEKKQNKNQSTSEDRGESTSDKEPIEKKNSILNKTEELEKQKMEQLKRLEMLRQYNLMQPNHPGICFFHLVFKVVGVFCYIFLGIIVTDNLVNFLLNFVCIVFDFWITKNVSGRYLVGLRWWTDVDEDTGEEEWYYESYDYNITFSSIDSSVFWWGMILNTVFWGIMFTLKLFSLNFIWGLLTFVGMLLNGMNVWGYYKCSQQYKNKLSNLTQLLLQ